jgi:hypothetical protein
MESVIKALDAVNNSNSHEGQLAAAAALHTLAKNDHYVVYWLGQMPGRLTVLLALLEGAAGVAAQEHAAGVYQCVLEQLAWHMPSTPDSTCLAEMPGLAAGLEGVLHSSNSTPAAKASAAAAIADMAHEHPRAKVLLGQRHHLLSHLVDALSSPHPGVQSAAAKALRYLAGEASIAWRLSALPGFMPWLVAALSGAAGPEAQEHAAGAFSNLVWYVPNSRSSMAAVPGLAAGLVQAIDPSNSTPAAQEVAVHAIAILAQDPVARTLLVRQQGLLPLLVETLSSDLELQGVELPGVQQAAAAALCTLSGEPAAAQELAGVAGCVPQLVELLEGVGSYVPHGVSDTPSWQEQAGQVLLLRQAAATAEHAAAALCNLARYVEGSRASMAAAPGLVTGLQQVLNSGSSSPGAKASAAETIRLLEAASRHRVSRGGAAGG